MKIHMTTKQTYIYQLGIILWMVLAGITWASDPSNPGTPPKQNNPIDDTAAFSTALLNWSEVIDKAKAFQATDDRSSRIIAGASEACSLPIVQRARHLAEVGQNRTWLDGRSHALEDETRETFALAMSDFGACRLLSAELPLLAAGFRLTGDTKLPERILAQLREMTSWSPLQRPGWTLYTPGNRLPADGKDGNWLATGCGIRAIGDTLELMPTSSIPEDLREELVALLEKEVASIFDDWQTKRPWFVRDENPVTNQWVLPTEGLVRACLILGRTKHVEAYELGVTNLLKALDAHGQAGEFEEGFGYASFTMESLLHAAHAMAVQGDRRALDHPFLLNFPTWLVHHFQPGGYVINCFDAGPAFNAAEKVQPLLSLIAFCTGDPVARWALRFQIQGPSDDLAGLAASTLPEAKPSDAPPLFAAYERATRVNWRSSWDRDATGVWVRGGHPLDQHDHQDRGHVNFIAHGKPLLIEAGTPSYDHKRMMTHYSSCLGHNVLQIGTHLPKEEGTAAGKEVLLPGWQKVGCIAPIHVDDLGPSGGKVETDCSVCYENLDCWKRRVTWSSTILDVTDEVELALDTNPEVLTFRWHLGTEEPVRIESNRAIWKDGVIQLQADTPIGLTQAQMPDNTLEGHDGSEDPRNIHTCLVVQTKEAVKKLRLKTHIQPQ